MCDAARDGPIEREPVAAVALCAQIAEERGGSASLRMRAALLSRAVDDFACTTAQRFHGRPSDSTEEMLAHYRRDHEP